jgi:DNA primase
MSDIIVINLLSSFLGEYRKYNEDSKQISYDCPLCDDDKHKGNLEINYDLGVFKCWSCSDYNSMHGKISKLIRKHGNDKILKTYLLIKPDEYTKRDKGEIEVFLPDEYKKLSDCSPKDYKYSEAMEYLKNRGITQEIIQDYQIGYAFTGIYHNRIIIPSFDKYGFINYFIARWFPKKKNKLKYINPEAEKMEVIFNEKLINFDSTIYLVEGAFDHIVIPNSITLLGKVISPKLLELLHDNAMSYVVIVLDDDAKLDTIELFKQLNFGNLRGRVRICIPPNGYDPSLIFEKLGYKGVIKLLKTTRLPTEKELY